MFNAATLILYAGRYSSFIITMHGLVANGFPFFVCAYGLSFFFPILQVQMAHNSQSSFSWRLANSRQDAIAPHLFLVFSPH